MSEPYPCVRVRDGLPKGVRPVELKASDKPMHRGFEYEPAPKPRKPWDVQDFLAAVEPKPVPAVHPGDTRRCNVCRQVKPTSEFYIDRSRNDGLMRRCRLCHKSVSHRARDGK